MKKNTRALIAGFSVLTLVSACGSSGTESEEETSSSTNSSETESADSSSNEKLSEEAFKKEAVAYKKGLDPDTIVKVEGTVSQVLPEDQAGNPFGRQAYSLTYYSPDQRDLFTTISDQDNIKRNDQVTVFGRFTGTTEAGTPKITGYYSETTEPDAGTAGKEVSRDLLTFLGDYVYSGEEAYHYYEAFVNNSDEYITPDSPSATWYDAGGSEAASTGGNGVQVYPEIIPPGETGYVSSKITSTASPVEVEAALSPVVSENRPAQLNVENEQLNRSTGEEPLHVNAAIENENQEAYSDIQLYTLFYNAKGDFIGLEAEVPEQSIRPLGTLNYRLDVTTFPYDESSGVAEAVTHAYVKTEELDQQK